jgi:hypothetical protein
MSGCEEVLVILIGVGRGEGVTAAGEAFLTEHAQICPECRRRLANERALSAGLSAVAAAQLTGPPPAIKTALMAEFRRQQSVVPIRRSLPRWVAVAAIAAALLVALLFARGGRRTQPVVAQVHYPAPVAPPAQAAAPEPAVRPVVQAVDRTPHRARRRPAVHRTLPTPPAALAEQAQAPEIATDFFEIPYVEPLRPDQRGDVFRIQMPRANMAVFGLPLSGGRLDARVTADVLMGEDGVARAIRFIR